MDEDERTKPSPRISVQTKLTRIRLPRVRIDYDVETGAALERRELPFVIGVLADLSGSRREPPPAIRDRRFVEVDADNFDQVMGSIVPKAAFKTSDGAVVDREFRKLDDFDPDAVASACIPGWSDLPGDVVAERLNAILHAPQFKQLEATWRGLHYLVTQVETGASLKVQILDVTKLELLRDLERSPEPDQSGLFRKVCEEPYGTIDVHPFGLVLVDFEFSRHPQDISLLIGLSAVGASAQTPFVGGAGPELLGLEQFSEIGELRDLGKIFATVEYARWRAFRDTENARFVALTLPRILLRRAWRGRCGGLEFTERVDGPAGYSWGSAAYALGVCVANAFVRYGWCANIRGLEGGGIVEGLPAATTVDDGDTVKTVTEVQISDRRETELAQLGLVPLLSVKGRDYAVFFSMSTCAQPRRYALDNATANSRLSTQLQYVLTASRFAQYLKCISRDKVGSFMSRRQTEEYLNQWIGYYVLQDDQGTMADKARRPLREARIEVDEIPGRPGVYRAIAYLRPHYQLEELSVSLRLVVDLGPAVGAWA